MLPHADSALLFVSPDSAAEEETSSKITGHMTGTKLSFNKGLPQKHKLLICFLVKHDFFFLHLFFRFV